MNISEKEMEAIVWHVRKEAIEKRNLVRLLSKTDWREVVLENPSVFNWELRRQAYHLLQHSKHNQERKERELLKENRMVIEEV